MPTKIDISGSGRMKCCFDEFTPWAPWTSRGVLTDPKGDYPVSTYPGVYLLGRFSRGVPQGPADYLSAGVVYVGEGHNLGRRWYQFEKSAFRAKPGHSGGWSYRARYASDSQDLYVAALPIWFGGDMHASAEDWTQAYRLYVERYIIWELTAARGGAHGLLNGK